MTDHAIQPLRWVLGVDLRENSLGAASFGLWVQRRPHGADDEFEVVHAVRNPESTPLATRALEDALAEIGLRGEHVWMVAQDFSDPVSALADRCVALDAHAVVIGRRPPRSDGRARLGRTSRRLLRAHPGPVVIVPHDCRADTLGRGPLLAASELGDDSVAACRFTQALARRWGTGWVLGHARPHSPATAPYGLAPAAVPPTDPVDGASAAAFVGSHGLTPTDVRIVRGEVVQSILALGEELDAPLIVTGSRRVGALGRLFSTSVGSNLAAAAFRAVAVVPPDVELTPPLDGLSRSP
jgi:nucleotide-binding universal stress UspA family protein